MKTKFTLKELNMIQSWLDDHNLKPSYITIYPYSKRGLGAYNLLCADLNHHAIITLLNPDNKLYDLKALTLQLSQYFKCN